MAWARAPHRYLSYAFLLAVAVQFFLAGLGVFRAHGGGNLYESGTFDPHRALGTALQIASLVILILALLGRWRVRLSAVLFVLMVLQSVLVGAADSAPAVAALHPVNGLAILAVAHFLTRPAKTEAEPAATTPVAETAD